MFFKIKIILILFLWKTKYCQNLCGFQVGVAADGKSRGAKKGEEKENLGHGHSPDAHHHLSHAPWQGRPGAQQGSFLGDQGREEEERRQMGFASRIRPSLLTAWHLVGGFELFFSRAGDMMVGPSWVAGKDWWPGGGTSERRGGGRGGASTRRPGLATRDHPMSSSPQNALTVYVFTKNALLATQRRSCQQQVCPATSGCGVNDISCLKSWVRCWNFLLTSKGRALPLKQKSSTDVRIQFSCFFKCKF